MSVNCMRALFGRANLAMLVVAAAATASGAVTGDLSIVGANGGVTVFANKIDWLPLGTGVGGFTVQCSTLNCIGPSGDTSLLYTSNAGPGQHLTPNQSGTIKDLTAPTAFPVLDFMTLAGIPTTNLTINLSGLGPISPTIGCQTITQGFSCSPVIGGQVSPFILGWDAPTTVSVRLNIFGTAKDFSGISSTYTGQFSTQFVGTDAQTNTTYTPAHIETNFNTIAGYSLTSSYSALLAQFTPVPEPGSAYFMAVGLGLLGAGMIKRARS